MIAGRNEWRIRAQISSRFHVESIQEGGILIDRLPPGSWSLRFGIPERVDRGRGSVAGVSFTPIFPRSHPTFKRVGILPVIASKVLAHKPPCKVVGAQGFGVGVVSPIMSLRSQHRD